MSFLAWDMRAPRGFGRLRGYQAGLGDFSLPGVSLPSAGTDVGLTTQASAQVAQSSYDSRVIVRAPGSPLPVSTTQMATQVATSAPMLAPRLTTTDNVVDQVARAGQRVADQSMQAGTDATRSSGNSSTDAVIPVPGVEAVADQLVMESIVPRGLPWWVLFGGGVVGGALLVSIFGR